MDSGVILVIVIVLLPLGMIAMNKIKCRGKVMANILRDGQPMKQELCKVERGFIVYNGCGYHLFDDLHRDVGYPSGWPVFLQEQVQAYLIDEKDGIPLDWSVPYGEGIEMRRVRAREIATSLDTEVYAGFINKQKEAAAPAKKFNFRKALPMLLIAIGVLAALGWFMFMR